MPQKSQAKDTGGHSTFPSPALLHRKSHGDLSRPLRRLRRASLCCPKKGTSITSALMNKKSKNSYGWLGWTVTVFVETHAPDWPASIVLRRAPGLRKN